MKIKSIILLLTLAAATPQTVCGQSVCEPFSLKDVRLLSSRFHDNFTRDSAWMMSVPVNSLLHSFRNTAGVFTGKEGGYMTVKKLGGWESLDCDLRGHTTGHLLSALAALYAQTGSAAVKAKSDSIISGLGEVQRAYGNGYLSAYGEELINRNMRGTSVWAPWYTLHKILQGLIDQYTLCGSDSALAIASRMGEWAYNKTHGTDDTTRRKMLRNEFGGFNDAMYQLYMITGNVHFLETARFFYHNEKVDPLKQGNADLGTNHANTFIPKLLGECRNYDISGDNTSRKAAELLFTTLAGKHAFATGEVSDKEHLFAPGEQYKHLSGYDGENCCTFNLLKLARNVFTWNADEASADYMERALYNHILGQQDPTTGMVTYFTPLASGAYRLYSTRDSSFWCCVGSGFESHVGYASYIYFHSDDTLFVNLQIPSEVNWNGTVITQQSDFPHVGKSTLTINGKNKRFALRLRKPWWATSLTVKVNGKRQKASLKAPVVERLWRQGDCVEIEYGMTLNEEAAGDNPQCVALMYGPIVLAGELDSVSSPFSDPSKYNDYYTYDYKIPAEIKAKASISGLDEIKKDGKADFVTASGIRLVPFFDVHHKRYIVYWNKTDNK